MADRAHFVLIIQGEADADQVYSVLEAAVGELVDGGAAVYGAEVLAGGNASTMVVASGGGLPPRAIRSWRPSGNPAGIFMPPAYEVKPGGDGT
jgi:hypothetical protein